MPNGFHPSAWSHSEFPPAQLLSSPRPPTGHSPTTHSATETARRPRARRGRRSFVQLLHDIVFQLLNARRTTQTPTRRPLCARESTDLNADSPLLRSASP